MRRLVFLGVGAALLGGACSSSDGDSGPWGASGHAGDAGAAGQAAAGGGAGAAGHAGAAGQGGAGGAADGGLQDAQVDAPADAEPSRLCPADMVLSQAPGDASLGSCVDRYEAPNHEGELPFVMFSLDESIAWCERRHKRLCYDDEWERACAGEAAYRFPYGNVREPGRCNDDKRWLAYNQTLLNGWPYTFDASPYESLEALVDAVRALGRGAAADHVMALYQAEAAGEHPGCISEVGVHDLVGNVEEWTLRRDGGAPGFRGNLKGRYWADTRTCQDNILTHGDGFRFYEIGFRCCQDAGVRE